MAERTPLGRKETRTQLWGACGEEQGKGIGPTRGRAAASVSLRKKSIRENIRPRYFNG